MKTRLTLSVAAFAFALFAPYGTAAQQQHERLIRRLPVENNEPIEITDIRVNGQTISLDKNFGADDDWLKGLTVSVKNRSDKAILFASIRLQFPRAIGFEKPISIYDMFWGDWSLQTQLPKTEKKSEELKPGDAADIQLSAQRFTNLRNFLNGTDYPSSITNVDLSIGHVIFEDDTMWYAGAIARRDPKDPTTWINFRYANR